MELDDDALNILRSQVKAQEDANRLKTAEINVLRRREQLSLDERDATVKLRAEVERLVSELRELSEEISASTSLGMLLAKRVDKLADELADVEQGLYSVLSRDLTEMARSKVRLGSNIENNEELKTHYRNLARLKYQAARHGIDVPLHIANAIDAEERAIEELENGT